MTLWQAGSRTTLIVGLLAPLPARVHADDFGGLVGFAPPPRKCSPPTCAAVGGTGTEERACRSSSTHQTDRRPSRPPCSPARCGRTLEWTVEVVVPPVCTGGVAIRNAAVPRTYPTEAAFVLQLRKTYRAEPDRIADDLETGPDGVVHWIGK